MDLSNGRCSVTFRRYRHHPVEAHSRTAAHGLARLLPASAAPTRTHRAAPARKRVAGSLGPRAARVIDRRGAIVCGGRRAATGSRLRWRAGEVDRYPVNKTEGSWFELRCVGHVYASYKLTSATGRSSFAIVAINRRRARASRDITVPIGIPVTSAISR